MPKLRLSQKSKVPLPGTPQRVQTDIMDSQPPIPRWNNKVLQETRLVLNVQHVQNLLKTLPVHGCEGEEVFFCEGTCLCWYHRWCVGVTGARFQVLSESNEPFLFQACICHQQHIIIRELQSCVQALTGEIRELKAAVCELQITVQAGSYTTNYREFNWRGQVTLECCS